MRKKKNPKNLPPIKMVRFKNRYIHIVYRLWCINDNKILYRNHLLIYQLISSKYVLLFHRYVTVQINPLDKSDKPLTLKSTALHYAIQQKVELMFGDFGVAAIKAGFNGNKCKNRVDLLLLIISNLQIFYRNEAINFFFSFLSAKYFNSHTRIALIKVRHGPHRFIIDSVPAINEVGGRFASIDIIYVGATMKHCFQFIQASIVFLFCIEIMYLKLKIKIET